MAKRSASKSSVIKNAPLAVRRSFERGEASAVRIDSTGTPQYGFLKSEGPAIARPTSTFPCSASASGLGRGASSSTHHLSLRERTVQILSSSPGRAEASNIFRDGVLAESSRRSKASKLETLQLFAEAANIELFPLTPSGLGVVLGAMKMAGYVSADSYVSTARVRHIELKHAIDDNLLLFLRGAERSMQRGRGPVKRAPVIDPIEVASKIIAKQQYSVKHGPRDAWNSLVVSLWWLLRGIECINLQLSNAAWACRGSKAELRLGATKSDIQGTGKRRLFDCICGAGDLPEILCPVCCLCDQVESRRADGALDCDPLFCCPDGTSMATSCGLVKAWNLIIGSAPCFSDTGQELNREITEHTARRSGTQFHIKRGLMLWQVQYIGRWGGSTVETYAAEAFAELRSSWSVTTAKGVKENTSMDGGCGDFGAALWEIKADIAAMSHAIGDVDELRKLVAKSRHVTAVMNMSDKQLSDIADEVKVEDATYLPEKFPLEHHLKSGHACFVINRSSAKAHKVFLHDLVNTPPGSWVTACGWKFLQDGVFQTSRPIGNLCIKPACFKHDQAPVRIEHAGHMKGESDSDE